jgi:chitinase
MFNTPTGKRAIYYHTNWACYGRNYQVKDIPQDVVDIAYAFYNLDSLGNVISGDSWADTDKRYIGADSVSPPDSWNDTSSSQFFGNLGQFQKLKNSGREINIQLSIGGWTWSKYFSDAVSSAQNRKNFVNNIINLFKKYPVFSGVSLDWEYLSEDGVNYGNGGNIVRKEDSENFILFLQELRKQFQQNNMEKYVISFCCVADPNKAKFPIERVHPLIDELHVMTYDFHDGNWGETKSAHHTNPRKSSHGVFSCEEAADFYLSRGVPSSKIFIGGAFYSRGFANTDGLGKSASGGSPDMTWEKGVVDYKDLPLNGATEFFDNEAKAAYSYDPIKKVFNSYDNKDSIIEKCKIIYEKNLAGIIVWENAGDKRSYTDQRSLTRVLRDNLTHGKPVGVIPEPPPLPPLQPVTPPQPPVTPPQPSVTPPVTPIVVQPIGCQTQCNCLCSGLKGIKLSFDINIKDGSVNNTNVQLKK